MLLEFTSICNKWKKIGKIEKLKSWKIYAEAVYDQTVKKEITHPQDGARGGGGLQMPTKYIPVFSILKLTN